MSRIPALENLTERLRASLWFTPSIMVAISIAAFILLLRLDAEAVPIPLPLAFSGDTAAARDVAAAIAGAMIGLIGVVFSLTILALQLASSQFSPRALRGFLRDRLTKFTLGAFVATLVYALLTLRHVESTTGSPNLLTSGLFLATFLSIIAFIAYIDHVAHSIRVVNILETIAHETRKAIRRALPDEHDARDADPGDPFDRSGDAVELRHDEPGAVLATVDHDSLVECAREAGATIELLVHAGVYVRRGAVLARVHGVVEVPDGIRDSLAFDVERTMQDDVAFGFRQLVDVGLRALSPGINDPTTAVETLDRIHDLLGMLVDRDEPDAWRRDDGGVPRLWMPVTTWSDYVALALDELRIAGAGHLQVHRRMLHLLEDLLGAAPAHRAAPLRARRDALLRAVPESFDRELDIAAAVAPDATGRG